ncbi:glycosyltransferase [Algoriphagus sp. D3-2-R+10]|uniref:glycosyltransferase n=1 Tax=Algoriphagus aurantiacus TaxID=3103948 RepID=UPI002B3A2BF7|nr:glycosyltransferase [Algoriphagus sp. D3-2-R+10]MEB2775584.1 glycosyltransferase [Algoriphagus sp. D3-2-R+10]
MLSFYLIWSLSYLALLWWMSRFWEINGYKAIDLSFTPLVTLIIPFRNEAKNIPSLSLNLKKLSYPSLEILLIDDHSEDDSFRLLEKCFSENQNVQVLRSQKEGKKSALELGVKLANGEIILCSDADCDFQDFWIERMVLSFQNPKVQLVAGAVQVEGKGEFLDVFQAIDWASILLLTNYSFANKAPLMCSGANLAYRKEAFEQVNGYDGNREFPSGDDEFLMKKIHKLYGKGACYYLATLDSLVKTKPEPTWNALINQRVRWASKWNAHSSISHALSSAAAFFTQLVWIGSAYLIFLGGKGVLAFALVWAIKIYAEQLSLGKVLKTLGSKPSNLSILQTSFVHPFYVLRVGIGALSGKFTWKGREN